MKSRLHHAPRNDSCKCVRTKDSIVMRMPTEMADIQVKAGYAVYVPKKEWKAQLAAQRATQEKKVA